MQRAHSANSFRPAPRWIAPSTPPPPSRTNWRVDDGVNAQRCNVGNDNLQPRFAELARGEAQAEAAR